MTDSVELRRPDLAELRALWEAASPAPWVLQGTYPPWNQTIIGGTKTVLAEGSRLKHEADAALIVAMHAALPQLADRIEELEAALREAKRPHYYCDDCWYSCPKADGGCCDDSNGDACNCGADDFNARIDALFGVPGSLVEPTPDK